MPAAAALRRLLLVEEVPPEEVLPEPARLEAERFERELQQAEWAAALAGPEPALRARERSAQKARAAAGRKCSG
jgi:hypothetical protein